METLARANAYPGEEWQYGPLVDIVDIQYHEIGNKAEPVDYHDIMRYHLHRPKTARELLEIFTKPQETLIAECEEMYCHKIIGMQRVHTTDLVPPLKAGTFYTYIEYFTHTNMRFAPIANLELNVYSPFVYPVGKDWAMRFKVSYGGRRDPSKNAESECVFPYIRIGDNKTNMTALLSGKQYYPIPLSKEACNQFTDSSERRTALEQSEITLSEGLDENWDSIADLTQMVEKETLV